MKITQRTFSGATDLQQMAALVNAFPTDNLHVIDLPYRFSSWALDELQNTQLWVDEAGKVVAWVVMQTPFWAIDYACHPAVSAQLHPQLLAWADQRARQLLGSDFGRPIWFVNVFDDQHDRIHDLEAAGFACQSDVGENSWSKVFMLLSAEAEATTQRLPEGFTIRPLAGETEVDGYVQLHRSAFQSKNMSPEWRQRTLRQAQYRPEVDLVIEAPNGELAAFCICWFSQTGFDDQPAGQIEPLGVDEKYHRHGLGRAILSEGIRRLRALGAKQVFVETDNYRDAAMALYEAVGFRVHRNVLVYRKDFA